MKKTFFLILIASTAFAVERFYATITGTGQQSIVVKPGSYRLQCRATSTNDALVRFRTSDTDGGVTANDPEIAFKLADGTKLDPYPISIPPGDNRLNIAAADGGSVDCSLFRMVNSATW